MRAAFKLCLVTKVTKACPETDFTSTLMVHPQPSRLSGNFVIDREDVARWL